MADEFGRGLIPRDYSAFPSGYLSCAPSAPNDWIIPETEWDERLKEQQANKASLLDLREDNYEFLKSLNQTNHLLCWGFSTTKSAMYEYAVMGTPIVLSPWFTAGMANGWRNVGGWGAQSLLEMRNTGGVPMEACPEFSSRYATAENKALAAKRKVIEWYDGSESRDRNRALMISAFLISKSPTLDFNHLSHSMAGCCLNKLKPNLEIYCDNSWSAIDQYGPKGLYKLSGSKAIPDGIVIPRVIQPVS